MGRPRWQAWLVLALGLAPAAYITYLFYRAIFLFPAATLPAIGGSLAGYFHGRSRGLSIATQTNKDLGLQGHTALWGLIASATVYAGFAIAGVGIPDPSISMGWRIFGGLVLGAVAGVAAGMLLPVYVALYEMAKAMILAGRGRAV